MICLLSEAVSHFILGFFGKNEYAKKTEIRLDEKLGKPLCRECSIWQMFKIPKPTHVKGDQNFDNLGIIELRGLVPTLISGV